MSSKSDFIKEGDGYADITLAKAIRIAGADVTVLRMREPTVGDQVAAQAGGGTDADVEVRLMGNLCQMGPEEMRGLTMRNYKRVQAAYKCFTD